MGDRLSANPLYSLQQAISSESCNATVPAHDENKHIEEPALKRTPLKQDGLCGTLQKRTASPGQDGLRGTLLKPVYSQWDENRTDIWTKEMVYDRNNVSRTSDQNVEPRYNCKSETAKAEGKQCPTGTISQRWGKILPTPTIVVKSPMGKKQHYSNF